MLNKDDHHAQHRGSSPSIQEESEKPEMTGMEWIERGRQIRDGNPPPDVTIPGAPPRARAQTDDKRVSGKHKKHERD